MRAVGAIVRRLERWGAGGAPGLLVGLLAWVSPALAEPSSDWLERYDVASACPAATAFRAMVLGRLSDHPDALTRQRVQIEIACAQSGDAWIGRLSSTDATGRRISREVVDGSCSALAQALSLVVALSVEEALSEPASEPAAGGEAPPVESSSAAGIDAWGAAPLPDELDAGAPEPLEPSRGTFRAEPLLRAAVQSGFAPRPALGLGGGVAFEWEGPGRLSPRLELSVLVFDGPSLSPSLDVEVEFEASMLNASLCPLELAAEPWSLRPCLDLQAGRLTASGSGRALARSEERHAPWLGSGASLQAGVAPWSGPVRLSVALGGFLPLSRHEFYFSPDIAVFDVPVAGWRGAGGLGVAF